MDGATGVRFRDNEDGTVTDTLTNLMCRKWMMAEVEREPRPNHIPVSWPLLVTRIGDYQRKANSSR